MSKKTEPELILLKYLKDLPDGGMLQRSPIGPEDARTWAAKYGADKVFYWEHTSSAFIVKEVEKT